MAAAAQVWPLRLRAAVVLFMRVMEGLARVMVRLV
jgi:hypothetical protein